MYDENGNRLHGDEVDEQLKKDKADGIAGLVESYIRSFHDLNNAIETTPEKILKKLSPVKSRILGMFRNGEVPTEFYPADELYVDPSVPDERLLTLFAMRVRDKIISFVLQETTAKRASEKGDTMI